MKRNLKELELNDLIQANNSLLSFKKNKTSKKKNISKYTTFIIFFLIILLVFLINFIFKKKALSQVKQNIKKFENNYFLDFEFHNFEREIITEKIRKNAGYELGYNEPYFINGIIRKFKPKKCLEIGVSKGGSAILILNALKDIKDSFLVSLDLNKNLYTNKRYKTGYRVKKYFPELAENNKWKLFTGEQPHKFLDKLNLKFDFLYLDTIHLIPGEVINMIETLPFLEENAIVVMHDIMFHLPSFRYYNPKEIKYHPSQIYLMLALSGNKAIIESKNKGVENIGAIFLNPNQDKYYLNYFLLLLSPWEYMPTETQINELRIFIKKYYKKDIYLHIFNKAVEENTNYINNFKSLYNRLFNKK